MEKELVNIKNELELQNFPRVINIINKLKKKFKNSIDLLKIEIVIDHYQICVLNKDRIQKKIE